MSANITSMCLTCHGRADMCRCKAGPQIVCGTCLKSLDTCQCDPEFLYHECEVCFEWKMCYQVGDNLQWICEPCQARPAVKFRLEHGGV
jgi:hypothetical protein